MEILIATKAFSRITELKMILREKWPEIELFSLRDKKEPGEMLTLHEESLLTVPALGLKIACYPEADVTEKEHALSLIRRLETLSEEQRNGYWECTLTLSSVEGIIKIVQERAEGTLLTETRGRNGSGFETLFMKYDYNHTLAELESSIKNRISPLRRAFDRLYGTLSTALTPLDLTLS